MASGLGLIGTDRASPKRRRPLRKVRSVARRSELSCRRDRDPVLRSCTCPRGRSRVPGRRWRATSVPAWFGEPGSGPCTPTPGASRSTRSRTRERETPRGHRDVGGSRPDSHSEQTAHQNDVAWLFPSRDGKEGSTSPGDRRTCRPRPRIRPGAFTICPGHTHCDGAEAAGKWRYGQQDCPLRKSRSGCTYGPAENQFEEAGIEFGASRPAAAVVSRPAPRDSVAHRSMWRDHAVFLRPPPGRRTRPDGSSPAFDAPTPLWTIAPPTRTARAPARTRLCACIRPSAPGQQPPLIDSSTTLTGGITARTESARTRRTPLPETRRDAGGHSARLSATAGQRVTVRLHASRRPPHECGYAG
jgi:hypothetical protein